MPLFRSVPLWLALLAALASQCFASKRNWLELRSSHFRVVTDAGEKRGSEVIQHCEQMRAAFSVLMPQASVNDPAPLLILALNSEQEVDELTPTQGRNVRHAGIFVPGADASFIVLDASGNPWRTVIHEYAHELLHANSSAGTQTWFEEGFAEYFSTLTSNRNAIELGRVPLGELEFLRQKGKLMRLADLIAVNQSSAIYNLNGPSQATFYAQSWLLVHYLFDHQLIGRARPFFTMMGDGILLDQAVSSSFGMTAEKMERELLSYAQGQEFRYFTLPPAKEQFTTPAVETLSDATAASLKLDARWHAEVEHTREQAARYAAEYRFLLTREPDNSAAKHGLGLALLEGGNYPEALNYFQQEVRADPENVRGHHDLARVLIAMQSGGHDGIDAPDSGEEAAACIGLDPDYADAYSLAAAAQKRRRDFAAAAASLRKAIALSPRVETYTLELADVELKERDYTTAIALLQQLVRSRDPKIVEQAQFFLAADAQRKQAGDN